MKLSLFADDMIVYMENPIDSTKKLLDLINEFGKRAGYKVNTEKSNAFLYTNNETSEAEIRKKIPFDIVTRKMVLGDLDSYVQKNETQSRTYTIHKNKFKVNKRLKYKL